MQNETTPSNALKQALIGAVIGILAGVGIALVLAIPAAKAGVGGVVGYSWIVLAAAALVGGFATGCRSGKNGLLWGAVCGAAVFAVAAMVGLGLYQDISLTALLKAVICIGLGAIGGIGGVNLSGRRGTGSFFRTSRRYGR